MKRLKSTHKLIATTLSIATTFLCTISPVSALDKSAASEYAIRYCGMCSPVPTCGRESPDGRNPYYSAYTAADCTDFVSQILYTGGFAQTSTPSNSWVSGDGCKSYSSDSWYFRKIIDKNANLVSVWSSSWTTAHMYHGVNPSWGFHARMKKIGIRRNEGLTFSQLLNLSGTDRVKEGDIIQIADGSVNYGHSIYVIYAPTYKGNNIDILYCAHDNDAFYKSLKGVYNGNTSTKFVVWHTSDY